MEVLGPVNPRSTGVPCPGGPGGPGILMWAGKLGGGLRLGKGCLAGGPFVLLNSFQKFSEGTPRPLTVVLGAGAG